MRVFLEFIRNKVYHKTTLSYGKLVKEYINTEMSSCNNALVRGHNIRVRILSRTNLVKNVTTNN